MTTDLRPLRTFADEMVAASPETTVAAIFRPDVFGPDVSESAVLIEAIRAGVSDFLRRPLSSTDLDQLFGRVVRGGAAAGRIGVLGKVLSFVSNKGGVGKSTLAVAAACNLARTAPDRVLLVDASLQMGVCAATLDLRPATSLTDAARERDRLDETLVRQLALSHPCGLHLLAAPHDAIEAGEVDEEVISRVLMLARRSYDFVVVDTFPMLDQVVMAILDLSDRAYVVVESVVPTVLGAVQFLQLLDGLGIAARPTTGGAQPLRPLARPPDAGRRGGPSRPGHRCGRAVSQAGDYRHELWAAVRAGRPNVMGIRPGAAELERRLLLGGRRPGVAARP